MSLNCPGGQVYTVRRGDTLSLIAQRYNTTVMDIMRANPQITNPNLIIVGQQICVPGAGTPCPGFSYTIKAGDTLYSLAQRYNITVRDILNVNPGINPDNLQVGQVICIPAEPPPVPRPRCIVLAPTDLTPNSKGAVFVETDIPSVLGIITNVPDPTVFEGQEVYKLFVSTPTGARSVVGTMQEVFPGYWIGRVVPQFTLTGANILIAATTAASNQPQVGVAVGTL